MDSESILADTPGLPYIDVTSHVMLWELLNSHDWASSSTLILRPDETTVEVVARRVLDGPLPTSYCTSPTSNSSRAEVPSRRATSAFDH